MTVQEVRVDPTLEAAAAGDVTRWLRAAEGDGEALGRVIAAVYGDLKRMASNHLRRERDNRTLQTTALVHEAWLELARQRRVRFVGRSHFFGLVSILMERILRLRLRHRRAVKRGGAVRPETLPQDLPAPEVTGLSSELLADLLARLQRIDPLKADIVRLRVWHGLTVAECAEQLGVSRATIDRHWALARSWFYDALLP